MEEELLTFNYKVLNKRKNWESWTGTFKTNGEALTWYAKYGKSHEGRGHKLALFQGSNKV